MKLILCVLIFFSCGCSVTRERQTASTETHKKWTLPAAALENLDACLLLYNLKTHQIEKVIGDSRCRQREAPCSTFKVPLAAMALDSKVLKDENVLMKWDGVERGIAAWNRDHTASGWMRESVVWYSQRLTPQIGMKKISNYLKKFQYGNRDFSGGLTSAWLTPAGFITEKPQNTLKISAYEQLEFMKKLWSNTLPVSQHALDVTKKLTYLETSPKGYILNGKTGSGFVEGSQKRIGWFIAHLQKGDEQYISVVTFTDKEDGLEKEIFAGQHAKEININFFKENLDW